ncbi:hypothetical protein Gogos_011455 [Gossypium gossypioides]|uniref:Uncharacterized protein n=1 Tax=Gossypium gossypioides TaxID=34282 RepID=A0A7J9BPE4_GOSGO|nr:hypothetical protein [Gossypium gossypioides]
MNLRLLQQSHQPRCLRLASLMVTISFPRFFLRLLRAVSTLKAMVSLVASRRSPLEKPIQIHEAEGRSSRQRKFRVHLQCD